MHARVRLIQLMIASLGVVSASADVPKAGPRRKPNSIESRAVQAWRGQRSRYAELRRSFEKERQERFRELERSGPKLTPAEFNDYLQTLHEVVQFETSIMDRAAKRFEHAFSEEMLKELEALRAELERTYQKHFRDLSPAQLKKIRKETEKYERSFVVESPEIQQWVQGRVQVLTVQLREKIYKRFDYGHATRRSSKLEAELTRRWEASLGDWAVKYAAQIRQSIADGSFVGPDAKGESLVQPAELTNLEVRLRKMQRFEEAWGQRLDESAKGSFARIKELAVGEAFLDRVQKGDDEALYLSPSLRLAFLSGLHESKLINDSIFSSLRGLSFSSFAQSETSLLARSAERGNFPEARPQTPESALKYKSVELYGQQWPAEIRALLDPVNGALHKATVNVRKEKGPHLEASLQKILTFRDALRDRLSDLFAALAEPGRPNAEAVGRYVQEYLRAAAIATKSEPLRALGFDPQAMLASLPLSDWVANPPVVPANPDAATVARAVTEAKRPFSDYLDELRELVKKPVTKGKILAEIHDLDNELKRSEAQRKAPALEAPVPIVVSQDLLEHHHSLSTLVALRLQDLDAAAARSVPPVSRAVTAAIAKERTRLASAREWVEAATLLIDPKARVPGQRRTLETRLNDFLQRKSLRERRAETLRVFQDAKPGERVAFPGGTPAFLKDATLADASKPVEARLLDHLQALDVNLREAEKDFDRLVETIASPPELAPLRSSSASPRERLEEYRKRLGDGSDAAEVQTLENALRSGSHASRDTYTAHLGRVSWEAGPVRPYGPDPKIVRIRSEQMDPRASGDPRDLDERARMASLLFQEVVARGSAFRKAAEAAGWKVSVEGSEEFVRALGGP